MSNRPFDVETVVLSREYLESLHGRLSFEEPAERPTVPREQTPAQPAQAAEGASADESARGPADVWLS